MKATYGKVIVLFHILLFSTSNCVSVRRRRILGIDKDPIHDHKLVTYSSQANQVPDRQGQIESQNKFGKTYKRRMKESNPTQINPRPTESPEVSKDKSKKRRNRTGHEPFQSKEGKTYYWPTYIPPNKLKRIPENERKEYHKSRKEYQNAKKQYERIFGNEVEKEKAKEYFENRRQTVKKYNQKSRYKLVLLKDKVKQNSATKEELEQFQFKQDQKIKSAQKFHKNHREEINRKASQFRRENLERFKMYSRNYRKRQKQKQEQEEEKSDQD